LRSTDVKKRITVLTALENSAHGTAGFRV
jgi:hypothetical protein